MTLEPETILRGFGMTIVVFDYSPFFEMMKRKGIPQSQLIRRFNVSPALLSRMAKRRNMTLATMSCLMKTFGITDVRDFVRIRYVRI